MKQLNSYFFLCVLLFNSFLLKAQFDSEKYDKQCFLIGTLNGYMGYQRTFTHKDGFNYQRIDIMSQDEFKNALFIDSTFNSDYSDIMIVNNGASLGIKLYSPSLSLKIDNYYNYRPTGITSMQGDTVYVGSLKKEKFETEQQKLSFLLGVYLRYGRDTEFFMTNDPDKARICYDFLQDLGCNNVEYVILKGMIPVPHHITFTPSDKVRKIIIEAERLRKHIETINASYVKFTPDGTKFIWVKPDIPSFQQRATKDTVVVIIGNTKK